MTSNDAVGAANLSLTILLIGKLKEKNIISDPEMEEMMDKALLGLEQMQPNVEARNATHALLTQLRDILCPLPSAKPE